MAADAKDFWVPREVARVAGLTPLQFYRDYVAKNVPVIFTDLIRDWEALSHWKDEAYLVAAAGDKTVTIDVTPTGRGDAIVHHEGRDVFVKPEEKSMTLAEFFTLFRESATNPRMNAGNSRIVPYLSHQQDSLRVELPELADDVREAIPFAVEAFGNTPDTVNVWCGDQRAISMVHKDPYENMYCVIRGQKHFTLLPPCDAAFLYEQEYPAGRYQNVGSDDGASIVMSEDGETVPWIPVDVDNPDFGKFPMFKHASPIRCVVKPGETLYLPALWFHQVAQYGTTMAVNFMHDMAFDAKYVYFNLVSALVAPASPASMEDVEDSGGAAAGSA